MYFLFYVMLILGLIIGVLVVLFFASKKSVLDLEKFSTFECGFNPMKIFRFTFSLQFFLIALIFLIFDVELILMFPFLLKGSFIINFYSFFFLIFFLLIVFFGLYVEWNNKGLEWVE